MNRKLVVFLSLVALQGLDALSTKLVFAHGGFEMNPVVNHFGLLSSKLFGVLLAATIALACSRPRHFRIAWVVAAGYVFVVGWNLSLLLK